MSDKELLVVTEENQSLILAAFTQEDGLKSMVDDAKDVVDSFEHDLSTAAGRKRTASLSAKVSKLKVKLDSMGKDLVADAKKKIKVVDNSRKSMREDLDALRDEARRPLTEWEAEEEARKQREAEEAEAKRLAEQLENDHEMALLLNEKYDREAKEAAEEAERIAKAEADRIAKEAAEAEAKRIADQKSHEEELKRQAAEQAEREKAEAIKQAAEAKQAAIDAEKLRALEAKQAEANRIEAERVAKINAEAAAEAARLAEIARQDAIKAQEAKDLATLEANKKHVGACRRQTKESLMSIGITEADAKKIVLAVSSGKISRLTMSYEV